jgi:hypothetical protein
MKISTKGIYPEPRAAKGIVTELPDRLTTPVK